MKPPGISICIPTYNGREHLAECIAGIRAQTFPDFEVVVCDDASSDGTLDRARELAAGDARFRFLPNPGRFGLVGNWNHCVHQARGEWIKLVFQDDVILPDCLKKLLAACQQTGRPFGFCERDFIFEEGVPENLRGWFEGHKQRLRADYQSGPVVAAEWATRLAVRDPRHNLVGEPTVTLIKKSVFRELGGFDDALIQLCDSEFWFRVMVNRGAAFVPESLARFRIHAQATTALNHGKRAYRMMVLDPLVLRYRFAFGRHYKNVRDGQVTGKSRSTLYRECALAAKAAWEQARLEEPVAGNSLMSEWQEVRSRCRGLQLLVQLGAAADGYQRAKRRIARLAL